MSEMNETTDLADFSPLPRGPKPRSAHFTVDAHGHAGAPEIEKLVAGRTERTEEMAAMARASGTQSMSFNAAHMLPEAMARMGSLDRRLNDLDWMGIDHQVVSPSPNQYCYWAEPGLADDIVAAGNQAIYDVVSRSGGRLSGLGLVSLQHPQAAARQLEDAMAGHRFAGVEISASVGERELSDASFEPFWEAADALCAVVFIHPLGSSLGARLDRFYLSNTIGQPVETTIALLSLISAGVLDRWPRIRFLAAHGGGYLPHYIGRADHAWHVRPEARGSAELPSAYLRRIWFDTVVFRPENIALLVALAGEDKVLMGTDYPFDMGDYAPHDLIATNSGLGAAAQAAILGGNAASLFGINTGDHR
jgi:aminocarboxymuconate-semialdehyde decarboxylase